ncbi:MAG: SRPBCC family protein [Solirubrobacteraceae bacterium]
MAHVRGEIVIDRPPPEVFDFVADECNEPRYNPRLVTAEQLTAGPVGQGTRFRAQTTRMGRSVPMTIEITGYDRPRRLTSATHMSSMDIAGSLTFEPAGGTRMRWHWEIRPRGALALMAPLIGLLGARQEREIWGRLKGHLEG